MGWPNQSEGSGIKVCQPASIGSRRLAGHSLPPGKQKTPEKKTPNP